MIMEEVSRNKLDLTGVHNETVDSRVSLKKPKVNQIDDESLPEEVSSKYNFSEDASLAIVEEQKKLNAGLKAKAMKYKILSEVNNRQLSKLKAENYELKIAI